MKLMYNNTYSWEERKTLWSEPQRVPLPDMHMSICIHIIMTVIRID